MTYDNLNLNKYLQQIYSPSATQSNFVSGYQFDSMFDRNVINQTYLQDSAVVSGKIATDAVTTINIVGSAITEVKISDNSISAGKVQANAITADKISVGYLSAISASMGTLTAGLINGGTINATNASVINLSATNITTGTMSANFLTAGTINASNIAVINLSATNITTGTMSANYLSAGTINASSISITNINANNITTGTITGLTVTSSSGTSRISLTNGNQINFYWNGSIVTTMQSNSVGVAAGGEWYLTGGMSTNASNSPPSGGIWTGALTVGGDVNMTNGNLDDVASIDGGGNDVAFNDSIDMNGNNINDCNAINVDFIDVRNETKVQVNDDLHVTGALSKSSGTFDIPHPDPSKEGMRLRHSFVESPTAGDLIYRYEADVKKGKAEIKLPDYFKYLNVNPQVWVSPIDVLGIARATCTLEDASIYADKDGKYNVLIIGTRGDELGMRGWEKYGLEYKSSDGFSKEALAIMKCKEDEYVKKSKLENTGQAIV